ncbi:MAG TPA: ATP-binding protein [Acidimicrobiia bacterium]|nr:ATP-binding protein [Acidimicrobiia bacterium]
MSLRGPGKTPLALRFVLYSALAYLVLIGAIGWFVSRSVEDAFTERLFDHLETSARIAEAGMPASPEMVHAWVETMAAATGYRFTVIDAAGTVLADSHDEAADMENHASRTEVAAAMGGEIGRSTRLSESTGFDQHYLAVPADDDMVLRLSVAARDLAGGTWPYRNAIIVISVVVGLVGVAAIAWMARRLSRPIADLTGQTLALVETDSAHPMVRSSVREINQLATAISRLDTENRIRVQEAERASSTLEVVLGALPQGTVLFGDDDQVVYANPSAYQLLGAVPDALSGLVPFSFQTAVERCRELRAPATIDAEHGKPVRLLRAIATPFADDRRVLLVVVDVTERERAASVRRDFVANASHELKTPVSAIVASAEALQIAVERGDGSAPRFAVQIEASARQLDRLVADLLDLSRLERDEPDLEPLNLDPLVREEVERLRPATDASEISLTVHSTAVQVAGSRRDLAIAVRNLLDNAVRYTPSGGSIDVELTLVDGEVLLRVVDTGEGIPTRDLERVFERFYRVDSARARATGGTGLGLAIVKHVVESHGGRVEVLSELGLGSTFTVRLPLLKEEARASS